MTIVTHLDLPGERRSQECVQREGLYTCSGALGCYDREPHSPKAGAVLYSRSLHRRGGSKEEHELMLASHETSTPRILFIRTLEYQSHLLS